MNKADLIDKIAKDAGIAKARADAAINSLLSGIEGDLKKGGHVTLVGFGAFLSVIGRPEPAEIPRQVNPSRSPPRKW